MSAVTVAPPARPTFSRTKSALLGFFGNEAVQIAALLILALLLRLALHFRSPAFVGKDSQSYFLPGWEIARGEPFELGQRRTPGYPVFIAAVILLLGEELRSLALAQHLLGVATVGLTYLLGRLTFGWATGLLAGLFVALSGPLMIYERYVMSETHFTLVLTAAIVAGVWAIRQPTFLRWLAAGLLLGVAIVTRPLAQGLIPLLALAVLLSSGRSWRRAAAGLAALALGLVLTQGVWVVRNALYSGNVGASTFGRTLIARTAYYDRGFVFDSPTRGDADPLIQRARQIVQQGSKQRQSDGVIAGRLRQELNLDPVQVNRVMRDLALEAISQEPVYFLAGTLGFAHEILVTTEKPLREHWEEYKDANPWDERIRALVGPPTAAELAERSNASRLVSIYQPARFPTLLAVLFAAGVALASALPRFRPALLPAAAAAMMLLLSAGLNGPVERYRYPLEPLIDVVAAGGLIGSVGLAIAIIQRTRRERPEPQVEGRAATVS